MSNQKEVKDAVLCKLRTGAIQPFQIAGELRMMAIPSFEVKNLTEEILASYAKEHPRY